ncbi:hypothetical protein CCR75_009315 [Bremia lactucae]|uniref:DUF7920 domain-containing protein n=1 Tax=Bremia lactucae TaxID=4779 RepID=A0A976IMB3_BRELC|nr:hypothetical protein CCR75_009315 [Bremia lactucae]
MSSAFAALSPRLSNDLCCFMDALEYSQSSNVLMHMRSGRLQLEKFVMMQQSGATSFVQVLEKESWFWKEHLDKAKNDSNVKVQERHVLTDLLPGLQHIHDVKVGRPGKPDDSVYRTSEYARKWQPRGNCLAEWKAKSETYYFPLIRGYRKFSGQEDDGELEKQSEDAEEEMSKYFRKPQSQSKWLIMTSKENGEGGHLAVLKRSDGEFVYVLGSKNTHLVAQSIEDIAKTHEIQTKDGNNSQFFAADLIATAIFKMLLALEPAKQKLLCEFLWQTRTTASFEVLCPRHQHVQLLDYISDDTPVFYGLSLMTLNPPEVAEICVNPVLIYEFMRALGVRTVAYKVFDLNVVELEAAIDCSKNAYKHEGGVYLFLDDEASVIGMQKHKSVWYVCLRAIREKAKTLCRSLLSKKPSKCEAKPLLPIKALEVGKKSLRKRFETIPQFLRISNDVSNAYMTLGEHFLEYLFHQELFQGAATGREQEEKCMQVAKDVSDLFPVVWKRFLDDTGASDVIKQP